MSGHYNVISKQLETGDLQDRRADPLDVQKGTWQVTLTHDGSRTLRLDGSDVTFHSTSGAATESRHVFVNNSGIFENASSGGRIRILEIGFGTGLNFLLTADEAIRRSRTVDYVAIDQMLVPRGLFEELGFGGLVEYRCLVSQLGELLGENSPADLACPSVESVKTQGHPYVFGVSTARRVTLQLLLYDFRNVPMPAGPFDAIYFDPFGPDVNKEIWQANFLATMYPLLKPGGTLVSYCVKSAVQQSLRNAGFEVRAVRGPAGGKRQVLIATRPGGVNERKTGKEDQSHQ